MVPRCPECGSNETQHVGYDLKCLSCGETTELHDKPWERDEVTGEKPEKATKGMNTTETFGG